MAANRVAEWGQTAVVILTIIGACVSGALWIEKKTQKLDIAILDVRATHALDQAAVATRLTMAGWSRQQQQAFVDNLREVADHPVPSLE